MNSIESTIPVDPGNRRPSTIHSKHIPGYIQAFADDIMSLAEGDDLDVFWQRTQTTIKTIENWCQSKGLNISALKTKIFMFTWNRKWSLRPIEVCRETIELSNEVKLLGITLYTRQQANIQHSYRQLTKKCIGTLFQCKRAIGPTWGLSPKVCHWIYTAIIRPTLAYCSIVWIRAVENKINTKRLESVSSIWLAPCPRHRTQLLIISQEHPTSPTILKEKLQRGQLGWWVKATGPWRQPPPAKVLSRHTAPYRTTSFIPLTLTNMTAGILPNLNSSSTTATLSPTQQPHSQRTTKTD